MCCSQTPLRNWPLGRNWPSRISAYTLSTRPGPSSRVSEYWVSDYRVPELPMEAAESHEPSESDRVQRLQRQLRAMSAVNRQLHAQLEGGAVRLPGAAAAGGRGALTVRRATEGSVWLG